MGNNEAATPITNREEAINWLREHGKIEGGKYSLGRSKTQQFMALTGSPEPVQKAYLGSLKLLDSALTVIAADELKRIVKEGKKEGKSDEALKDTVFTAFVQNDHFNIQTRAGAFRQFRVPKTNEKRDQFGFVRTTYGAKKNPEIKALTEALSTEMAAIFNS